MISKCPDETLLVEYASGALSTAPSIAVTTHLKYCDKCRNAVSALGFHWRQFTRVSRRGRSVRRAPSTGVRPNRDTRRSPFSGEQEAIHHRRSSCVGTSRICQKPASEREAHLEESHQFARGCAYTESGKRISSSRFTGSTQEGKLPSMTTGVKKSQ